MTRGTAIMKKARQEKKGHAGQAGRERGGKVQKRPWQVMPDFPSTGSAFSSLSNL